MLPITTREAVDKQIALLLSNNWPQIASGYDNMKDMDVTLKIKLEAVDSGQTDERLKSSLTWTKSRNGPLTVSKKRTVSGLTLNK